MGSNSEKKIFGKKFGKSENSIIFVPLNFKT